jgi:3-phosphoglycerate kinase
VKIIWVRNLCLMLVVCSYELKCSLIIFQGRPKGVTPKFSLAPLVPRLSELLGIQVQVVHGSIEIENARVCWTIWLIYTT